MNYKDQKQLNLLHKDFYNKNATSWNSSRHASWKGWEDVWRIFNEVNQADNTAVLDLAAGNGRFLQFIMNQMEKADEITHLDYIGVDISDKLVAIAKQAAQNLTANVSAEFVTADVLDYTADLVEKFDLISIFGLTHHLLPEQLAKLLKRLSSNLTETGIIALTYWEPQTTNIVDKSEQLAEQEYLLDWGPDKTDMSRRYVRIYSDTEKAEITAQAGLKLKSEFAADGRNSQLNHYQILQAN